LVNLIYNPTINVAKIDVINTITMKIQSDKHRSLASDGIASSGKASFVGPLESFFKRFVIDFTSLFFFKFSRISTSERDFAAGSCDG
jgi:hypothetical protein